MLELLEDGAFNVNRAITMMLIAFIHDRLRAGGSGSQAAGWWNIGTRSVRRWSFSALPTTRSQKSEHVLRGGGVE